MKSNEALREILAKRGYSQRGFAEEHGLKGPSVTKTLGRVNSPVSTVNRYLTALGYTLAFVPVGSKLPDGSYAIDPEPFERKEPAHEA